MAANVNSNLASWSTTESSNSPAGTDASDIDAEFRMIQKVVRQYLATKGADIASASTVDLSTATGNYVHITGTTTVTALGTVSAGMRFLLVFDGALTFTHNVTSLILPGAENITTAAGDRCEVVSLGSGNWRCLWFQKASGYAVIAPYLPLAGGTMTGDITMSGASIFDANASIAAHATTMDPWSLGNYVTCTGAAVTFTAMANAPQAGAEVELYMNDAHVFTDGAVFEVDGDADFTAEAGDRVVLRAKSTTVFTVHPRKKDGTAVISSTGKIVQVVEGTPYATWTSSATAIPIDDTIPQNTEGTEINTVTITPTSATNRLRIEFDGVFAVSGSGLSATIALFQDTTAGALAAVGGRYADSSEIKAWPLSYEMAAGTTSATTFKIRFGPDSGTAYVNGSNAARKYGGVQAAKLRVTEILV